MFPLTGLTLPLKGSHTFTSMGLTLPPQQVSHFSLDGSHTFPWNGSHAFSLTVSQTVSQFPLMGPTFVYQQASLFPLDWSHTFLSRGLTLPPRCVPFMQCYLGSKLPDLAGVVLHSPLMSGVRVLSPTLRWWPSWADVFPNHTLVPKIKAPVLIMHVSEHV